MKPYYSEFAAHALRCWARGHRPVDEAGALTQQGVIRALGHFAQREQMIFQVLYSAREPFNRALCDYSVLHGVPEGQLWNLIRELERRVAKECGIL